jgi:AAA+ superfamily predicted ATPase
MKAIVEHQLLPKAEFAAAWASIKIESDVQERLIAQALLCLTIRQKLAFEIAPLHGLIVLSGPPGTGKTTLSRGLANEVAKALQPKRMTFVQVDPHALASAALGRSQQEMTKLFQQTIPEIAANGPTVVLLDEVETMVADRHRMSLEANPVDVHRATDAALSGLDALARQHRNILLVATTNFPEALDRALLSRADLIEHIGPPGDAARQVIIREVLEHLAGEWPAIGQLTKSLDTFVHVSEGLDGRRLRKAVIAAAASTIETARDPNRLTADHVVAALRASSAGTREVVHEGAA